MIHRYAGLAALGLALAGACAEGEDEKSAAAGGGAGGDTSEPALGGEATRPSGAGGEREALPSNGSGGELSAAGAAGQPNGGAEPAGATPGGGGGAGGASPSSEPGPISLCGKGKYDAGEGCAVCPAPPSPSVPVTLGCSYVEAASVSAELELSLTFTAGYPVHEGFSGTAQLHWVDPSDNEGEAEVPWRYSADRSFLFTLPLEARYADHFDVKAWDFTDACGFPFAAGTDLQVTSDGQGNWYCGPPG